MRFVLAASLAFTIASPALADPLRGFTGLALSPRGDRIATIETAPGAKRATIAIRNARGGQIVRSLDPCGTCSYAGLTFGPDGSLAWLARDRAAGTVMLSVETNGRTRTIATVKGIAQTPRFSPDGSRAITGSRDDTAKLWELQGGKELMTLTGHSQEVTTVAFSTDGKNALSGGADGTIVVWPTVDWKATSPANDRPPQPVVSAP